jgi:uncharacterized protein (DUF1330 family)
MITSLLTLALCAPLSGCAQTSTFAPNVVTPTSSSELNPAYLLVIGKTNNPAGLRSYSSALAPIYAQHNAYYLAVGGAGRGVAWLEGPWRDRSLVLGQFPSQNEVEAFWWGEPYRAAARKRDRIGVFSVVSVTGSAQNALDGPMAGYLVVMTGRRNDSAEQSQATLETANALRDSIVLSGGRPLTSGQLGDLVPLEGDTIFDSVTIAAWPTQAARDAYLASPAAQTVAKLRAALGYSAVVSANGVARAQIPPKINTKLPAGG